MCVNQWQNDRVQCGTPYKNAPRWPNMSLTRRRNEPVLITHPLNILPRKSHGFAASKSQLWNIKEKLINFIEKKEPFFCILNLERVKLVILSYYSFLKLMLNWYFLISTQMSRVYSVCIRTFTLTGRHRQIRKICHFLQNLSSSRWTSGNPL